MAVNFSPQPHLPQVAGLTDKQTLIFDDARYKAFISYSHRDDRWASWLHKALESYKPPKQLIGTVNEFGVVPGKMAPVFRDREELPSATDLGALLTLSLENSACQIVICSPAAARSHWVNEEILAFKRLGREHRIYCLIVDGEPNATDMPGREEEECFPPALRYKLDADGNLSDERTEPIAADARKNKDGKNNAKIKLLAGMLGVGFDQLAQREMHRRQQRMILVAAASITGMVITSGLAVAAFLAQQEAERQRIRAEIEAETAQQTTSFMVELFEVSDPSEALGNTITAREILDRGARRIEFELTDQPEIQSTLMDTMGTVYRSLGLYPQARDLLERGLETRRTVYGSDHPEVVRSQANIAQLLGLQAEFEGAVNLYEEAIRSLRESSDANNEEVAEMLSALAQVYSLQGDFATAEEQLREAIQLQRVESDYRSLALAQSLDRLGMALAFQAKAVEAEPLLREALEMRRDLTPGGVHPDLDDSLNNLAVFLYEQGRFEETESLFRESLEMKRQLLGEDHPELGISLNNLAFVLHDTGSLEESEQYYLQALVIAREGLGEDHPQFAQALNNLAFLYYDQGKLEQALDYSRQALDAYQRAHNGDHPDLAYAMQNLAGWLTEQGDYFTAESMLNEALAMNLRILPEGHPDIGITQSGMAVLMLETDRSALALEMASESIEILAGAYGNEHWRTAWAKSIKAAALTELSRYDEAEPLAINAYEALRDSAGARPVQVSAALKRVVELYESWGKPDEATSFSDLVETAKTP